jgi:hypothetical protein
MLTTILLGAVVAVGTIIIAHKTGIRKVAGHETTSDVVLTVGLGVLFAGTYSGLLTAAIAGIIISLYLAAVNKVTTVQRFGIHNGRIGWYNVPV